MVKIEGQVWHIIYHHLPVVKGVNKPLYDSINQPMGKGHLCSQHFPAMCLFQRKLQHTPSGHAMIEVWHEGIAPAAQVIGVLFGLMDQVERHRQPSQDLTAGDAAATSDASESSYLVHIWLVVYPIYGSWDDDIPNMMGKINMFQTTNQFSMLKMISYTFFLGDITIQKCFKTSSPLFRSAILGKFSGRHRDFEAHPETLI